MRVHEKRCSESYAAVPKSLQDRVVGKVMLHVPHERAFQFALKRTHERVGE